MTSDLIMKQVCILVGCSMHNSTFRDRHIMRQVLLDIAIDRRTPIKPYGGMITFMVRNICAEVDCTIRMILNITNDSLEAFQMNFSGSNAIARHCGDSNKDVKTAQCD
jgi:hypothetical protein